MNIKVTGKLRKETMPIVNACYPDYKGRKIFLRPGDQAPKDLRSYWDEGSRTYYAFYNMDTNEVLQVHSNHPFFEPNQPSKLRELPDHILLVTHTISCGRDCGISVYGNMFGRIEVPSFSPTFA